MDRADHCVPVNDGVHSDEEDEMSCGETPYSVKEVSVGYCCTSYE